ncbi:MAG: hypothetical protein KAJ19_14475 [Gammaproteobacteria bacterium]|nr:hypothetical protein [Gammaproteobacteria bacterium]
MAKPMVLTKENVIKTMTCAKCGRVSSDFPCKCGSTEFLKGMTRRIINPQPKIVFDSDITFKSLIKPSGVVFQATSFDIDRPRTYTVKPRYQVGDEVYVAEGYQIDRYRYSGFDRLIVIGKYSADNAELYKELTQKESKRFDVRIFKYRPTPGRFMYRSLARTFRKITGVGVERVQDISHADAVAEGMGVWRHKKTEQYPNGQTWGVLGFSQLWSSIHGDGAWDRNDWVFWYKFDKE